ncbi:MAG TPA: hypothetical protein PK289_08165, partial [Bacteroidia bacterium]|nr:hypothetical protein [Bacteroidia bacterium]
FCCRQKKETKKTHHENQLQIFFSHKLTHYLAEKFAVRSFRGRQPHTLRLKFITLGTGVKETNVQFLK